jgi:beta-phosphoglucomutase-like phosphatase (HAD superfamily)
MRLELPAGSFKGYLFDCDGTIADSMPLHYIAWSKALSEWSCEFGEDLFYAWGGMPVSKIIATLNEKHGLNMPVDDVAKRKEEFYFEVLPQLKAVPEVLEHVKPAMGGFPAVFREHATGDRVFRNIEDPR